MEPDLWNTMTVCTHKCRNVHTVTWWSHVPNTQKKKMDVCNTLVRWCKIQPDGLPLLEGSQHFLLLFVSLLFFFFLTFTSSLPYKLDYNIGLNHLEDYICNYNNKFFTMRCSKQSLEITHSRLPTYGHVFPGKHSSRLLHDETPPSSRQNH